MREKSLWKGLVAGLAGGLAGSFAMGPVHEIAGRLGSMRGRSIVEGEDPTAKVADGVSETIAGRHLTQEEKKKGGPAVHFAFGGSMGAAYGAAAEFLPELTAAMGTGFGSALYAGAHAVALPALSLSKPVTESAPQAESAELAAHLVYGAVTEIVRQGVRRLLD